MSQNDFTIANQGFPAFRADLNSALQALASNSSGATAPSTTFANMWWYDSANNIMYIRNEDNDAWIKFAELDQTNDKFVLSGTLQLDDGTVSAPALTFNSDTNMGIYRGGTDILKFVTAGTDAITIDASQAVTLANDLSMDGDLNLVGSASQNLTLERSGASKIEIGASTAGVGNFINTATNDLFIKRTASFLKVLGIDNSTGDISFYEDTGTTPKLFWDASEERLGIGNSSPSSPLSLGDGASSITTFDLSGTNTGQDALFIVTSDETAGLNAKGNSIGFGGPDGHNGRKAAISAVQTDASDRDFVGLAFHTHNSATQTADMIEAMRITADGKLGIGTDSPTEKLDLVGGSLRIQRGSDTDTIVRLDGADGSTEYLGLGIASGNGVITGGGVGSTNTGLVFKTAASGTETERMRIYSGGDIQFYEDTGTTAKFYWSASNEHLGIGTSTTTTPLFINKAVADDTSTAITLQNSENGGYGGQIIFKSAQSNGNLLTAASIGTEGAAAWNSTGNTRSDLKFSTIGSGTGTLEERMRIDSNGQLFVGTTDTTLPDSSNASGLLYRPGNFLGVATTIGGNANLILNKTNSAAGDTILFRYNGSTVGSVSITASTTSYNTSSDHRLKENVTADWDATTRLKQLNPVRFNFIADANTTVDGFLAHEVQSVVPEAITGTHNEVEVWKDGEELPDGVSVGDNKLDEDGNTIPVYQGIDQSKLVPLLVKTIQELEARITALENGE